MALPIRPAEIIWNQAITLPAAAKFMGITHSTIRWHTSRVERPLSFNG